MSTLPDFQMDVTGEYSGNAYPEQTEYRIAIVNRPHFDFLMTVEDSSGGRVGEHAIDEAEAEGITWMASTNHDLGGYEDDWSLPAGMGRALYWVLQTDIDHTVSLDEDQIDQVAAWLRYATGEKEWDGGEEWEY